MKRDKDKILKEMLKLSIFDGWNDNTLKQAAKAAGFSEKKALIIFPNGACEVADYFSLIADDAMLKEMQKHDLDNMRIRDRIATGVMARMKFYNKKDKEAIRRVMAFHILPQNAGKLSSSLSRITSKIWYEIGDTSTDYNYYTKRMLLSGVLTSTILYWLNDDSKDLKNTEEFLYRRIEDVMKIEKAKAKIKEKLQSNS